MTITKLITAKDLPAATWDDVDMIRNQGHCIRIVKMNLTSMVGCPAIINHGMMIGYNPLVSLEGCPRIIPGDFDVYHNALKSLVGGPKEVRGVYVISYNPIVSLVGCPDRVEGDMLANNIDIAVIDALPSYIGGDLDLSYCLNLKSLHGINHFLKEMDGYLSLSNTDVVSHVLGLFFIKGCRGIDVYTASHTTLRVGRIVNKHIDKGRAGLLPCQKELIEAGLADFAQV